MYKKEMLESLQSIQEVIEESEFKEVTEEQREKLQDRYNKSFKFEYSRYNGYGYMFIMSESSFKSFEYYMGMEYEIDQIEFKIALDNKVIVCYSSDCERAEELYELLESVE